MRDTTKWLVAAAAAVGAVIVGGLQLTKLPSGAVASIMSLGGFTVALAGIAWILLAAAGVLSVGYSSLGEISDLRTVKPYEREKRRERNILELKEAIRDSKQGPAGAPVQEAAGAPEQEAAGETPTSRWTTYRRLAVQRGKLIVRLTVLIARLAIRKILRFFSPPVRSEGVRVRDVLFDLDREVGYYSNRLAKTVPDLIRQIADIDNKLIAVKGSISVKEPRTADDEREEALEWRLDRLEVGSRQIIAYANQKVIEHHFQTLKHAVQVGGLAVAVGVATFALAPKFGTADALDITQPTR